MSKDYPVITWSHWAYPSEITALSPEEYRYEARMMPISVNKSIRFLADFMEADLPDRGRVAQDFLEISQQKLKDLLKV